MDAFCIQTEVVVLPEKLVGGLVILIAGHDEPVKRLSITIPGGSNLLGKNLKEALLFDRGYGEGAFGAVVA
jgi:hypothetical protein